MNLFRIDLIQLKTFHVLFSRYDINRYLSESNLIVFDIYLPFIFMLRLQDLKMMFVFLLHSQLLILMNLSFKSILYRGYNL